MLPCFSPSSIPPAGRDGDDDEENGEDGPHCRFGLLHSGFAKLLLAACSLLGLAPVAGALSITLDFSYDSLANGGTGFFDSTPLARTAVTKAAQDIGNAILPSLGAVTTDVFSATSDGATATFNWELDFTHPFTGGDITLPSFTLAQDSFTVYVGMQKLTGNTLGQGGPAGAGFTVGLNGSMAGYAAALTAAQNASNAAMTREAGGSTGPVMGTLSGSIAGRPYSLSYGPLAGNLWFDIDTNNNGLQDSATELANFWSYDPNAPVAAGKNDLYSVALHEILHSLGFGTAETWDDLRSGTTWLGANAIAENGGSGTNLVTGDGHIRSGSMSTTLFGDVAQEAVMDPSLTTGTRKFLTNMDAAFLRDIGYAIIPEPSSLSMLAAASLLLLRKRRS